MKLNKSKGVEGLKVMCLYHQSLTKRGIYSGSWWQLISFQNKVNSISL